MNWDDLTAVWRGQPGEVMSAAYLETLKKTFPKRSRRLARKLFWRDSRAFVACIVVVGVLARAAIQKGLAGWPLWISIVVALGFAVFFLKERIRAHRSRTGPNAALLERIDADLGELRHQRELLLRVGSWGLGTLFLSWLIGLASTGFHGLNGSLRTPIQMGSYVAGGGLLFWVTWKLNRRALRKSIEPRLADLEKLKNGLQSQD